MKKFFTILTVLLMVLTLCACHEHRWLTADCTTPEICEECGMTCGSPLGHDWEDATCTTPKTCSVCGEREGSLASHDWEVATCISPKTCCNCGLNEGDALGHDWEEATCTAPKTCSVCGKKEGTLANHDWKAATCISPKTCCNCDLNEGDALGHDWEEATCTAPKTCAVCGEKEGALANHVWKDATCSSPKTCFSCGKEEGNVINHDWEEATCTMPKTCLACGKTEGSAKGHNWETINNYSNECNTCGAKEIDQSKLPVELGSLKPCSGGNYYSKKNKQDIYGNMFYKGLSFLLNHYGPAKESSSEYVLNKEYRKFTTTIMVDEGSYDDFEGRIKIYVDNILVYDSQTIKKKTRPIKIDIDISNAVFIKFETTGIARSGYILLENPTLHH